MLTELLSDSWKFLTSPPSMAAESMEIDDSLYRQVYHLSYIIVFLAGYLKRYKCKHTTVKEDRIDSNKS